MGTISEKLTYLNDTKIALKNTINLTNADITNQTTFRDYSTKLYDGYINILKNRNILLDNMPKSTSTGYITDAADLPIYEDKMSKVSTQNDKILPTEYTQVEYIESTGTQYIDTGIKLDVNYGFDIKLYTTNDIVQTNVYGCIFGGRDSSGLNEYQLTTFRTIALKGTGTLRWGGNSSGKHLPVNFEYNTIEQCSLRNKVFTGPDGTQSSITVDSNASNYNCYLFGLNNGSSGFAQSGAGCRIYYLKLYNGDTLVRDFIPCYRNSDNVAGFYDYVNKVFYTNQGTGSFIIGNAVTLPTQDFQTPSPSYPQEVKTVKGYRNLFNQNTLVPKKSIDSSTGEIIDFAGTAASEEYISVEPNKIYILSASRNVQVLRVSEYASDKSHIKRVQSSSNVNYFTFTVSSNCYFIRISFSYDGSEMTQEKINNVNFMLNEGAENLPYVPYGTNWVYTTISDGTNTKIISLPLNDNEIVGLDSYKDELIIDKNGKCWLNKKTGKVVLNGSETWNYQYANGYNTDIENLKQTTGNNDQPYVICDYYTKGSANTVYQNNYGISQRPNYSAIIIKNKDMANATALKTWLSTHNTEIYYVLITPQLIDLNYTVDTTLFKDINNISNSDGMDIELIYITNNQ